MKKVFDILDKIVVTSFKTATAYVGLITVILLLLIVRNWWNSSEIVEISLTAGNKLHNEKYLVVGDKDIAIDIADNREERALGLGGRESLDKDSGMLFIYPRSGDYDIWMKDMNFSIDIIWIDSRFNIVHIEENISPDTYPDSFSSPKKAKYILEVNSGFVKENFIKISDTIIIL